MKISVIIPVYNHERYVASSILSVLNQNYSDVELLVINDGSSDGSHNTIINMESLDRFKYINKDNEGLSKTLQLGVSLSTGEYIAILASDDEWLPNKLSIQVAHMEKNPDCVACCAKVNNIDEHGIVTEMSAGCKIERLSFEDIMLNGASIPPATILIRKDSLKNHFFDPSLKVEDLFLWLSLTENGGYLDILPQILANYRIHSTNTTGNLALIAKYHHITLDRFKNKPVYGLAKTRWSLFSFRQLTRNYKLVSLKYIRFNREFLISKSFLISVFKLIFIWR